MLQSSTRQSIRQSIITTTPIEPHASEDSKSLDPSFNNHSRGPSSSVYSRSTSASGSSSLGILEGSLTDLSLSSNPQGTNSRPQCPLSASNFQGDFSPNFPSSDMSGPSESSTRNVQLKNDVRTRANFNASSEDHIEGSSGSSQTAIRKLRSALTRPW